MAKFTQDRDGNVNLGDSQVLNSSGDRIDQQLNVLTSPTVTFTQTYSTTTATVATPTAAALTVTDGAGTNDLTIAAITADASVIAAVQELAEMVNKQTADSLILFKLVNQIIDVLQAKKLSL